jgi:hypothetical protein
MSWFSRKGDYSTNTRSTATGSGKHAASDSTPSKQSENYTAKHAVKPYKGTHRAGGTK